jgi:D-alanyl-D-alanine carboxypeptidase
MACHSCRRRLGRRVVTAVLALAIALSPLVQAYAAEGDRHAVLVVDANTGRTLYQRSADEPRFPASLAKLMTLYLLFEQLEQGRLSLTTKIRFSANAAGASPSNLDIEEGTEIAVIDAIRALIVKSANDVAVAVAEHIAGSEEKFAELMSRKARDLGMTTTVFRNASGLPDAGQVTTARDMVTLALRLHDQFPKHFPLFATRTFTWGGETYRNHNTLLFRYGGLDGMKTGYIRASGFNLVASARRGKKHVVAAYFGGKTAALRNAAVRTHLDAGFVKASDKRTREPGPLLLAQAKAPPPTAPTPPSNSPPDPERAKTASEPKAPSAPLPIAAVPAPQPASRPPLAATVPGIEVVRVRPVLAEGTAPASAGSDPSPSVLMEGSRQLRAGSEPTPPADIEDLLNRPAPPSAESTALLVPEPVAAPSGPFQVQVGAYETEREAERQLAWVRQRAGPVLGAHAAHMSQVKRGDRTYFRARYVGFDGRSAADGVCSALRRLEIDCLVMRAE